MHAPRRCAKYGTGYPNSNWRWKFVRPSIIDFCFNRCSIICPSRNRNGASSSERSTDACALFRMKSFRCAPFLESTKCRLGNPLSDRIGHESVSACRALVFLGFSVCRQFWERREAAEGQGASRQSFAPPVLVADSLSDLDGQEYLTLGADHFDRIDVDQTRRSLVRPLELRASE